MRTTYLLCFAASLSACSSPTHPNTAATAVAVFSREIGPDDSVALIHSGAQDVTLYRFARTASMVTDAGLSSIASIDGVHDASVLPGGLTTPLSVMILVRDAPTPDDLAYITSLGGAQLTPFKNWIGGLVPLTKINQVAANERFLRAEVLTDVQHPID